MSQKCQIKVSLYDNEGETGKDGLFDFDEKTTLGELKLWIVDIFKIPTNHQGIYYNESRIGEFDDDILFDFGLKHRSQITLKHSDLDVWSKIIRREAGIQKNETNDQPTYAEHTLDLIDILEKSKFGICYPHLLEEMERISKEAKEYFGGDISTMQAATNQYFYDWLKAQEILKDPRSFEVSYGRKTGGIHSGCTATVCYDGTTDLYFIKTHHMGPTKSSSRSMAPPDLREVFAYLFLKSIGLGPECHFYGPPPNKGKTTLYIGTKSIPKLELMEFASENSSNIRNIIMEIHVASSILCLGDVHERNCGYYEGKASIFDFNVPPKDDYKMNLWKFQTNKPQCVDTLVNARNVGKMSAFAQTINSADRMKFGQSLVKEWKMSECVDAAVKEICLIKERIRKKGGVIEDTNDFNKYLDGVKYNIDLFN